MMSIRTMVELPAIFFLGLVYGATLCSLTCLPLLTPFLVGAGRGFADGLRTSLIFLAGKLLTYTALGGMAAWLGQSLELGNRQPLLLGLTLIAAALLIPLVSNRPCGSRCGVLGRTPLFLLGVVTSFAPCPPLATLFVLAAKEGVVAHGLLYGLFYGLGLTVSPLLLVGGGLALIGDRIRQQLGHGRIYLQGLAMGIMVLMGVQVML